MSKSSFLLTVLACVCFARLVHAQSLPTAAAGLAPDGLSAELTASVDHFRGNSDLFLLGASGYGRYRGPSDYAALFVSTGYAEAGSQRIFNALRILPRYRHELIDLFEGLGAELFGHYERAEQRRHLALMELGAGVYTQWFQSETFSWNTTIGYAFEYEKFTELTDPNDADVLRDARGRPKARGRPLTDSGIELNSHRAWIATEVSYLIRERVRIAEDLITMVPLDHCPCDTRAFSETAIRVIATPHFAMQTSLSILYDAAPARLVTSIDAIVKGSFVLSF